MNIHFIKSIKQIRKEKSKNNLKNNRKTKILLGVVSLIALIGAALSTY